GMSQKSESMILLPPPLQEDRNSEHELRTSSPNEAPATLNRETFRNCSTLSAS
ncbi:hypothetical protein H4219_005890, partial [Mycoemilia scoparia]